MSRIQAKRGIAELYRKDKKWFMKILLIGVIMLAALLYSIYERNTQSEIVLNPDEPVSGEQATTEEQVSGTEAEPETVSEGYVDISGAVNTPGVYKVTSETRLYELIEMAGGLTEDADIDSINQASTVSDGMKIIIPEIGQDIPGTSRMIGGTGNQESELVNINTADKSALMTLPGIGETYAERIIEYRNRTAFNSIEDLKNIKGIGEATFEKLRDRITV